MAINKFKVKVHMGKEAHFKTSLYSFDSNAKINSSVDQFTVETKLDEKQLSSLSSVKFVVSLNPPTAPSNILSVERLVLDVFSIPKDDKYVKIKDLDSGIEDTLFASFEFFNGEEYCILKKWATHSTQLSDFFTACSQKISASSQKEIKMIFSDVDTGENYPILSNSMDTYFVYLEFRSSRTYKF